MEIRYNQYVKNNANPNISCNYETFKEIELMFGKKNCVRLEGKMIVIKDEDILVYELVEQAEWELYI